MAAVDLPAVDAVVLLENLSLDSQTKDSAVTDTVKKPSVDAANGKVQPSNGSVVASILDSMDPSVAYYPNAYYYGGYDGTASDWDGYSRYMIPEGVDLAYGLYGYGYPPYATYTADGQLYGTQNYQYPSSYFQPPTPTGGPSPPKGDTNSPATTDQPPLVTDTTKESVGSGVDSKGNTGSLPVKPTPYQNSAYAKGSYGQNGYPDLGYGYNGLYSPIPWLNSSMSFDPQTKNNSGATKMSQNNLKVPNSMYGSSGYMNRMYPNNLYGQYGNTYRSGYYYGTNGYDPKNNGRGWSTVDNKFKPRMRGNGFYGYNNENSDGLNELNRGPRARTPKNQKPITPDAVAVDGQDITLSPTDGVVNEAKEVSVSPDREQYNKTEFPETYADAKFFIIKSYSEDDVHKSIKYNVWASTQNGNKKLDAAYREAQQSSEGCPVFLFFSVNTSGQFVGVAEMVGAVDFNKSLEYWQQDKWIGCFPVKWHIVKDIPNGLLKDIILDYNENKPVTNSRDTQEVRLVEGLQMIKIFKEHSSKQCILDDFEFYEDRQKKIQQKKAKQQQFQKQAWEGKTVTDKNTKEGVEGEVVKSDEDVPVLVNEGKLVDNVPDDVAKPAEVNVVVNDVANAC